MTTKFQDFSINFNRHPISGDLSLVTDEKSIAQSIKNLILTDKYEIPFNPNRAGHVRALLFELVTPFTAVDAETRIKLVLDAHEPRANVRKVEAKVMPDGNTLYISITYRAKTTTNDLSFDFYLDRVV